MDLLQDKLLNAFLASHHGVISRREAIELGILPHQIDWQVRAGRFVAFHRGVYRRSGEAVRPEAGLLAACLAAGAVASHTSAAWLWELLEQPPSRPSVTVSGRRPDRVAGVTVHRRDDVDHQRVIVHRQIPTTDPLRTLADLGESIDATDLDDAIDRALARRLVTVEGLEQEIDRLARRGRGGIAPLRSALRARAFVAAPQPSVLESRTLRLLRSWGVRPLGAEVVVLQGRYRVDFQLAPNVVLEVDGYAYHWSPEAKAADSRRRNELRLAGLAVIEAEWVSVMRDGDRLHDLVLATVDMVARAGTTA